MAADGSLMALAPGTITHADHRPPEARAAASAAARAGARPLRLCTWNIERGYELARIIQQLKAIDGDVLSLQELDVGCDRSGGADTFREIGAALRLNGLFLSEFEELRSPLRGARAQGGGVHGNAVFSKFDFTRWRVLEHSHHPIDWEAPPDRQPHPLAAKEPRRGRRAVLAADVAAPGGRVTVYNAHLEVFCGILGRVWQFSDILRDVKALEGDAAAEEAHAMGAAGAMDAAAEEDAAAHGGSVAGTVACRGAVAGADVAAKEAAGAAAGTAMDADAEEDAAARGGAAAGGDAAVAEAREAKGQLGQQRRRRPGRQPARRYAILGDLNTMANGVARLSPHYCCDDLRWRTLGMSEARYWQRHVFSFAGTDPSLVNAHFLALGLPRDVCRALVNPGFFDPFDPERDITLDNPAYRLGPLSLMTGKLDWALLKGLAPLSWRMANADWAASDHRALIVEAE